MQTIPKENTSLASDKAMLERRLNNLYTLVENGDADEFVLARINKLKADIRAVTEKISQLQNMKNIPQITEKEISDTLAALYEHITIKKDVESRKALINLFVDKIIVENKKLSLQITTERVLGLSGAEGRTRTGT